MSTSCSSADLSEQDILADELLRRVPSLSNTDFVTENTQTGERRLTSACFKISKGEDGLSVYSRTITDRNGLTCADVCCDPLNAVVVISGADPASRGLLTIPDPWPEGVPDPDHLRNAAHMLVTGIDQMGTGPAKRLAREWAKTAVIAHAP